MTKFQSWFRQALQRKQTRSILWLNFGHDLDTGHNYNKQGLAYNQISVAV
jgi:hypothetical protein